MNNKRLRKWCEFGIYLSNKILPQFALCPYIPIQRVLSCFLYPYVGKVCAQNEHGLEKQALDGNFSYRLNGIRHILRRKHLYIVRQKYTPRIYIM